MSPLALSLQHSPELLDPVLRDELENLQVQLQTWSGTIEQPGLSASSALARWTPVVGGSQGTSGQGYTQQYGLYTAIGRLIVAHFSLQMQVKGAMAGVVELQGLPVAASAEPADTFVSGSLGWANFATPWVNLAAMFTPNSTRATLVGARTASTHTFDPVLPGDLTNATHLRGMIVYFGRVAPGG